MDGTEGAAEGDMEACQRDEDGTRDRSLNLSIHSSFPSHLFPRHSPSRPDTPSPRPDAASLRPDSASLRPDASLDLHLSVQRSETSVLQSLLSLRSTFTSQLSPHGVSPLQRDSPVRMSSEEGGRSIVGHEVLAGEEWEAREEWGARERWEARDDGGLRRDEGADEDLLRRSNSALGLCRPPLRTTADSVLPRPASFLSPPLSLTRLSPDPSTNLSARLSLDPSTGLSARPSPYLSTSLSACLSPHPSVDAAARPLDVSVQSTSVMSVRR